MVIYQIYYTELGDKWLNNNLISNCKFLFYIQSANLSKLSEGVQLSFIPDK